MHGDEAAIEEAILATISLKTSFFIDRVIGYKMLLSNECYYRS